MRRRSILIAVGGCLVVGAAALLVGEPLVADAQLNAATRALAQASKHQSSIDAAMQQFLTAGPTGGGESDDQLLTASSTNLAQYESASNAITADVSALQQAMQPSWLVAGAWTKRDELQAARQRTATAIAALTEAGQVVTAAVDQERLQQGFFYASVTEAKMLTAIDDQQYVQVDAYYIQADRALRVSESLMGKADESPGYRPALTAMRSVIEQTKKYAAALLRNDQSSATALHATMRAGYSTLAAATNEAAVTANDEWNDRTYQPLVAAYHTGLAAILS